MHNALKLLAVCVVSCCVAAAPTSQPVFTVEKLATGFKFVEGAAWLGPDKGLLFSDIPANTQYRIPVGNRSAEVWLKPSGQSNGNTVGIAGQIISANHGTRNVTSRAADGTITVLADSYNSKPLNSPNDVIQLKDGTVIFTDPDYGLEGRKSEQDSRGVYLLPKGIAGAPLIRIASDFIEPNGLCVSPDEKYLYIAESDWRSPPPHVIRRFTLDLTANKITEVTPAPAPPFAGIAKGVPDGIRCDADGILWVTGGDGIYIFGPDGQPLGLIPLPETPANLCFAGDKPDADLYATARTSIYVIHNPRLAIKR